MANVQFFKTNQKAETDFPVSAFWYSRWESNPKLSLRRGLLYPFNYGSIGYLYYTIYLRCCQKFICPQPSNDIPKA